MIKLLNANFERLRKNKVFWFFITFSIGIALFMVFREYVNIKKYGDLPDVSQIILNYSIVIGIVIAIFTSLFLGVEYSDGAIRNKISMGHKRINIYLSNLIVTMITGLVYYILFLAVAIMVGVPLLGEITISTSKLLMLVGCILLMVLAYSSIFTFLALLISNKTITAIACIMASFGMMFIGFICLETLNAPQYIEQMEMKNGETEFVKEPNPKYPSETKRKVYQTLLDINPAGQAFQIVGNTAPNLEILPIYSLGIMVIFTGTGMLLFKKKELK